MEWLCDTASSVFLCPDGYCLPVLSRITPRSVTSVIMWETPTSSSLSPQHTCICLVEYFFKQLVMIHPKSTLDYFDDGSPSGRKLERIFTSFSFFEPNNFSHTFSLKTLIFIFKSNLKFIYFPFAFSYSDCCRSAHWSRGGHGHPSQAASPWQPGPCHHFKTSAFLIPHMFLTLQASHTGTRMPNSFHGT